jgi:hypothetical protein
VPPDLLPALADHLVAQGIARHPHVAGALPPLYVEPDRMPAPGEAADPTERHPDTVLALFVSPGIPPAPYESWLRRDGVQMRLLVRDVADAVAIERQIRAEIVDRRNWLMAGLQVIESLMWSDLARLGYDENAGATDFSANYLFELYAS